MDANIIAKNALRIWQHMNDGTTWCYNKIKSVSLLSDREINIALGWLAREDTLEIIPDPVTKEDTYKVRNFWDMAGF
ncbi:winged helix-turn-helix domain-containing protein [uncultured Muribaculum sp.]|uniref:winged helix-turn-helix domain-containing protein n=1 Tax=uncultured Muribaculum sp. TaxID=1918613 RepID=UPI00267510A8|nr:winged helix-turn-helix domain-containing protein [uncultured Muribaculum sp.]